MHPKERTTLRTLALALVATIAIASCSLSGPEQITIESDPADYDILFRANDFSADTTDSFHGDEDTVLVSIVDFPSVATEYYRAVLQFDISELTESVTSATFAVYLKQVGGSSFPVDVFGSSVNRADFVDWTTSAADNEFFASSYARLGSSPFISPSDAEFTWYELDVTSYLNDRISAQQTSPNDNVVLIMLRPDTTYTGTGFNTTFNFASGDDATNAPYLEIEL